MSTEPLLYAGGDIGEDAVQVGSVVEIPYGKNMENGIVAGVHKDSPISRESETFSRIKTIERIITHKILLHPYQIDIISAISAKYMIPIHRVLGIFLTRPILKRLERKNYEQLTDLNPIKHNEKIIQGKIHIFQDGIITPDIVENYINGPTVIILPDDFALIPYRKHDTNSNDILFATSDMTDTKKAQAWIDIANGVFSIIYGTRKILYYNLSKYRNIIYIEDALGPDYWHYPIRINYNDIFRIFVNINPSVYCTILTSIPTLATLVHFKHFEIKNISHP